MGSIFSSIHALHSDEASIIQRLKALDLKAIMTPDISAKTDPLLQSMMDDFIQWRNQLPPAVLKMLPQDKEFYLIHTADHISLFSHSIAFPDVSRFVRGCFKGFDKYIVSVEFFDNDVFYLGIYKGDTLLTAYCSGSGYEDEGYQESKFDPQILRDVFGVNEAQLAEAYHLERYPSCQMFSQLFNLPLCLSIDKIEGHPRSYSAKRISL